MQDTCCLESMNVWIQEEIKLISAQAWGRGSGSFSWAGDEWRDSEGGMVSVRQGGTKDIWLGLAGPPLPAHIFFNTSPASEASGNWLNQIMKKMIKMTTLSVKLTH